MLLLFGVLFLIHVFWPGLDYEVIFRCWPCIFILLGLEVLVGNHKAAGMAEEGQQVQFVYDKAAILLLICMTFFAMVMAVADVCIRYSGRYGI
jgi:hypothetical protein